MTDPHLKRLVDALDTATAWAADHGQTVWHDDVEIAQARLQVLRKRLGTAVSASPYLAFLGRIGATAAPTPALAAGA